MSRTRARFTQADVARAIRAAKQAGATVVELRPDGVISVALTPTGRPDNEANPLDERGEVEL